MWGALKSRKFSKILHRFIFLTSLFVMALNIWQLRSRSLRTGFHEIIVPDSSLNNSTDMTWTSDNFRADLTLIDRNDSVTINSVNFCPDIEHNTLLVGPLNMDIVNLSFSQNMSHVENSFPDVQGGHWIPLNCVPKHRVAIIIPFRDRMSHLTLWLAHVLDILKRQLVEFYIVLAEQKDFSEFNKGIIFNTAFQYVDRTFNVSCVMLHDVDLLPENDRIFYGCPEFPFHAATYVDTLGYELLYDVLVGGALSMSMEHYKLVNGFSNVYWGWGGEDDDMGMRILHNSLKILRPDNVTGRYKMLVHESRKRGAGASRFHLLDIAVKRYQVDGLAQNPGIVAKVNIKQLYHHLWINVDVGGGFRPDIGNLIIKRAQQ